MFKISGYTIQEEIYKSKNSTICRAINQSNSKAVILKILNHTFPKPEDIAKFKLEYEILKKFADNDGIINVFDLIQWENTLFIELEDFGGISLREILLQEKLSIKEFLFYAVKITEILATIHDKMIIHKDINPSNIIWNRRNGIIKIIDFGISTELSRENTFLLNPNHLEGTLTHISPEQTGRMNKKIDYRSDFYSLGVTFYQMLTTKLPFDYSDPGELVHSHIALSPAAPHSLNKSVSLVISDIIMKLMAKLPEKRYQNINSLKNDLNRCIELIDMKQNVNYFNIAENDISDRFHISEKIYGRKSEIRTILNSFNKISEGGIELLLVSGYSGIGKSSLINEIHKPITEKNGYFLTGKFDQFQKNIPYFAFKQAFTEFVNFLMTEPQDRLINWKSRILDSIGDNGILLCNLIPDLEKIIGKQNEVPELPAEEAENRFMLTLRNFVECITKDNNPLIIFLDDLQWCDSSTLKLIKSLIITHSTKKLLIIGAYRDNEVSKSHPLIDTIEEIKKYCCVNELVLKRLEQFDIEELLADTLYCNIREVIDLAELIMKKTNGNPFFVKEILKKWYEDFLVNFSHQDNRWFWKFDEILKSNISDNIVEFIISKLKTLPNRTQEIVQHASCIGNIFDFNNLKLATEYNSKDLITAINELIKNEIITPLNPKHRLTDAYNNDLEETLTELNLIYKFSHDKIQEASYSLIKKENLEQFHYKIGNIMLNKLDDEKIDENIIDITTHLNYGKSLINKQEEIDKLVLLNIQSGKKAKAAAAYQSAFIFFHESLSLLGKNAWKDYNLTFDLYLNAIELAYLISNYDLMEKWIKLALKNAKNEIDKVSVYKIKIKSLASQVKLIEAIETGVSALSHLELNIPSNPTEEEIHQQFAETGKILAGKSTDDLLNLPKMTDEKALATMNILSELVSSAYNARPNLMPILVLQHLNYSVKYGNSLESLYGYAAYGLILCGVVGDIQTGYEYGKLAKALLGKFDSKGIAPRTRHMVAAFIDHWKLHIKSVLKDLNEVFQTGQEVGDFFYSGAGIHVRSTYLFFSGENLDSYRKYADFSSEELRKIGVIIFQEYSKIFWQAAENLSVNYNNYLEIAGDRFTAEDKNKMIQQGKNVTGLYLIYFFEMMLAYIYRKYESAVKLSFEAEKYIGGVTALYHIPEFYFYQSLAFLKSDTPEKYRNQIDLSIAKFKNWSDHSSENHLHRYNLLLAENYKVLGDILLAMDHFELAIKQAGDNDFTQDKAIACELAADLYHSINKDKIGYMYMKEAHYLYTQWGAVIKAQILESNNPNLVKETVYENTTTKSTILTTIEHLDANSIIKASQAISSEVKHKNILKKMMNIVIENAGAEKGFFITINNSSLIIEAEADVKEDRVELIEPIDLSSTENPPLSIAVVNYVMRSKKTIAIENAVTDDRFFNDLFIKDSKAKSILCIPVIVRARLMGIIYLENNLMTEAFTIDKVETLKVIAAQTAISLENSLLYENLEEKVKERTEQLEKLTSELKELSVTDQLTKIFNRRKLDEVLDYEFEKSKRYNTDLSLIILDIDKFKSINDNYGHQIGDIILKEISSILRNNTRKIDTLGRWGGEEFLIICPNTNLDDAKLLAEKLRKLIENFNFTTVRRVTSSFGVSSIPSLSSSADTLIKKADAALYEAKEKGRNKVCSAEEL